MTEFQKEIDAYCIAVSNPETTVLQQLNRETHIKVMSPRMLSGPLQGNFLMMIAALIKPKRILEIGTYTGYSAICLASGLEEGGKFISIDINPETYQMAQKYVNEAGLGDKVELMTGDALKLIPELKEEWDLVFIDADKRNYSVYYDLVINKVKQGGWIIADNVLWSGKVLMKEDDMDVDTRAIHEFNKMVQQDPRVSNMLLPIRDGLMLMQKK